MENLPVLVVRPIPQKESITFMELQMPTPKFEELPHLYSVRARFVTGCGEQVVTILYPRTVF